MPRDRIGGIEVRPYGKEDDHDDLDYIERVEHYRDHVHDSHRDMYEELLAGNCSPRIAAAALRHVEEWVEGTETQEQVASAYETSHVAIRRRRDEVSPDVFDVLRGGDGHVA